MEFRIIASGVDLGELGQWLRHGCDTVEFQHVVGREVVVSLDNLRDNEVDRLRAVNAELLEACRANVNEWRKFAALNLKQQDTVDQTTDAIAKASEVTP